MSGPRDRREAADGPAASGDDPRVVQAVEEYLALRQAGKKPDRAEVLARHPDIAGVLSECLDGLEFIHQAGLGLHSSWTAPEPPEEPAAVSLGTPLGDFRIVREVGRGGMGIVYEAEQLSLRRRVALKVLPFAASFDARHLQRFRQEAEAAANLHHSHIVPVYGIGCERGVHYYAMQYIDGQSLAEAVRELRRQSGLELEESAIDSQVNKPGLATQSLAALTTQHSGRDPAYFRTVAQFGIQAAEALEYAHGQGVIHRDVKPANLLVEAQGKLWVTDFGLARLQDGGNVTLTGDIVGTLRYMSPEQALGRRAGLDNRTDIYSLGLTLYELLTLRPAFTGSNREELLRQITREEPRPPRAVRKEVPPELETVVLKAMARERDDRYVTAQELADDLRRFLDDQPIHARRPTLARRVTRWAGRHRSLVTAAAVATVLAVAALATFAGLVWREKERTRAAYEAEAEAHARLVRAHEAEAKALTEKTGAHEAEKLARAAEQEQRRRAERNLRLALDALDRICLQIAEKTFPRDPPREKEDRHLLEQALGFYEQFIQANDADPAVRFETGSAHRRVGDIRLHLGQTSQAIAAYGRAIALLDPLVAESPDGTAHRQELAWTLNNLGALLERSRRFAEAEEVHRRALALRRGLLEQFPTSRKQRQEVGTSLNNLGVVLVKSGRAPEAKGVWKQALDAREKLAAEDRGVPKYRQELASTQHNLATLYLTLGNAAEAEPLLQQAREALESLTANSGHPDYRIKLASTLNNLGGLLSSARRHAEAEKVFRQAVDVCEKLAAEFPTVPDYRHDLALNWNHLGNVLADLRRAPEAQQAFVRALGLLEKTATAPGAPPRFRETLAVVYVNLGSLLGETGRRREAEQAFQQALDLRKKLADEFPGVPEYQAKLAYAHHQIAMLLQATARPREAEQAYRVAIALLESVVAEQPRVPEYRNRLTALYLGLGQLLQESGRLAEAVEIYRQAAAHAGKLSPTASVRRTLAQAQRLLGSLLVELDRKADAADAYRRAVGAYEGLVADYPRAAGYQDELAWLLASCPLPQRRDAARAVELAQRAVELAPKQGTYWTTLGAAHCRAESWKEATAALEKSIQLTSGGDCVAGFFLAMAQWHLDEKEAARKNFGRAVQWMDKDRPGDVELRRLRAEAAVLLGVTGPAPDKDRP